MFKNYIDNKDSINAKEFGLIVGNMQTIIEFAGLPLDENDHGQLAKAFQILSKKLNIIDIGDDVSFSLKWSMQNIPFNSSFRDGVTFSFMNRLERTDSVTTVIFDDSISKPVFIPVGTVIPAGKIISITYDEMNDRFFVPKLATIMPPEFTTKMDELSTALDELKNQTDDLMINKPSGTEVETLYSTANASLDSDYINDVIIANFNPPTQAELNTLDTNLTNLINTLDAHIVSKNTFNADASIRSDEISSIENAERDISKVYLDDFLEVPVNSTDVPEDGIVIQMDDGSKNNPDITKFKFIDGVIKTGSIITVQSIQNTVREDIPQLVVPIEGSLFIARFEEVVIDLNGNNIDAVNLSGVVTSLICPEYITIEPTDIIQGFFDGVSFKVTAIDGKGLNPDSYTLTIIDDVVHALMTESLIEELVNLPTYLLWYKNALTNSTFISARDNATSLITTNKESLDKLGDLETIVFNAEPSSITTDYIHIDFGTDSHGNTEFDGSNNAHYIMTNSQYGTGECIFDATDYPNMTFSSYADVYKKTVLTRKWSLLEVPALLADISNRLAQVKTDGENKISEVETSVQNLSSSNDVCKGFITNTLNIWGNLGMKILNAPSTGFNVIQFGYDVRTLLSQANEAKSFFSQALDSDSTPDFSTADLVTVSLNDDEMTGFEVEDYFIMDSVPTTFPFRLKTTTINTSLRDVGKRHRVGMVKDGEVDYGLDDIGFPERFLLLDDTINLLPFQDDDELIIDKNDDGDLFIIGRRSSLESNLIDLIETYISELNALSNTIIDFTGKTIHTTNGISTDVLETIIYPEIQSDLSRTVDVMDGLTLIDYNEEADLPMDTLSMITVKGSIATMFDGVVMESFYNIPMDLPDGALILVYKQSDNDMLAGYVLHLKGYKLIQQTLVDSVGLDTTLGMLRMVFGVMSNIKAVSSKQNDLQTQLDKIAFYTDPTKIVQDERFSRSDAISDDFIAAYDSWITMNNDAITDIQNLLTAIAGIRAQFVYDANSTFVPDTIDGGEVDPKIIVENANLECNPTDKYYYPATRNDKETINNYPPIGLVTLKDVDVNTYGVITLSDYVDGDLTTHIRNIWEDAGGPIDTTIGNNLGNDYVPRNGDEVLLEYYPVDEHLYIHYVYIPVDDRIVPGNYFKLNAVNQAIILQIDLYAGRYIPTAVGTTYGTNIDEGKIPEGTYDDGGDATLYKVHTSTITTMGAILDSISGRDSKTCEADLLFEVVPGDRVIFSVSAQITDEEGNIIQPSSIIIHGVKRGGITNLEKPFKTGTVLVYDSDAYGNITVKSYSEDVYSKYVNVTTLITNSDYMIDLKSQIESYLYRPLISTASIRSNNLPNRLVSVENGEDIIIHNNSAKHSLMPFDTEMYERDIVTGVIAKQETPIVLATPTSRPNSVIGYGGVVVDSPAYDKGEDNTGVNDNNSGDYLDGLLPLCVRDATDVDSLRAYHRLCFNPNRQMMLVGDNILALANPTYHLGSPALASTKVAYPSISTNRLIAKDLNSVTLQIFAPIRIYVFYFTTDMTVDTRDIRYLEVVTPTETHRYYLDPSVSITNGQSYKFDNGTITNEDHGVIVNDANNSKDPQSGEYQAFINSENPNEILVYMTKTLSSTATFICRIIGSVTLDLDADAKLYVKGDPLYGVDDIEWNTTINAATNGTFTNPLILVRGDTFEVIADDTKNFVLSKNQPYNDTYLFRGGLLPEDNITRQQLIDMTDPTTLLGTNVGLKPETMAPDFSVAYSRTLVTTTAFYKEYTGPTNPLDANRLDIDYYGGFTTELNVEGGGFYISDSVKTIQDLVDASDAEVLSTKVFPSVVVNVGDLVNYTYNEAVPVMNIPSTFNILYHQPKNAGSVVVSIIELNNNTYIIKTIDKNGNTTETVISRDLAFLIKHNTRNNMVITLEGERVTHITIMSNNRIQTYSV